MLNRDEVIEQYRLVDRATPWLRVNFVSSLDGAATHDGLSGGLGNDDDRLVFDILRMLSDVIVVGAGTVRAEGYGGVRLSDADAAWRVGAGLPPQPRVAIVSSRLDISPEHPFFTEAAVTEAAVTDAAATDAAVTDAAVTDADGRPIVITHAASPADRRAALGEVADVLVCGEAAVDCGVMSEALAERGLTQVLCEGGPHLFGTLIDADRVDELCLTLSPVLENGSAGRIARGGAEASRSMTLMHALPAGDMLFLRYYRAR